MNRSVAVPDFSFSHADLARLRLHGVSEERAKGQLDLFRAGRKYTHLERACTLNDGIQKLTSAESETLTLAYANAAATGRTLQFTPASGAASRMFKGLLAIMHRSEPPDFNTLVKEAHTNADAKETVDWFSGLRKFAFFDRLRISLAMEGKDTEALIAAKHYRPILECLLKVLAYSDLPKALIPFHLYPEGAHTALAEQLAEAAELVKDQKGVCRIHLTVSPDHESAILIHLEEIRRRFAAAGITFDIALSQQKPSTDTLAVDEHNVPLRSADNSIILRPGGHGALLENLFHTAGDIVFIKNIDNVVPQRLRTGVLGHRQVLGGYLVQLQSQAFAFLDQLRRKPTAQGVAEAAKFAEHLLGAIPPPSVSASLNASQAGSLNEVKANTEYLIQVLDRPMRVCAMVKNQGEPGGGPFWVTGKDGSLRPQIVESAQVDLNSAGQRKVVESATHFNPVDMVCSLRDREGNLYKLQDFVDPDTCFITAKSKEGKIIKALELPGLWNGAMAYWNTVFVEMPVEIFNPVKTVNDLLRPTHQA